MGPSTAEHKACTYRYHRTYTMDPEATVRMGVIACIEPPCSRIVGNEDYPGSVTSTRNFTLGFHVLSGYILSVIDEPMPGQSLALMHLVVPARYETCTALYRNH